MIFNITTLRKSARNYRNQFSRYVRHQGIKECARRKGA